MGISGAYALRRRNPVFAAARNAALTIAPGAAGRHPAGADDRGQCRADLAQLLLSSAR
jgi:hypothetical protein